MSREVNDSRKAFLAAAWILTALALLAAAALLTLGCVALTVRAPVDVLASAVIVGTGVVAPAALTAFYKEHSLLRRFAVFGFCSMAGGFCFVLYAGETFRAVAYPPDPPTAPAYPVLLSAVAVAPALLTWFLLRQPSRVAVKQRRDVT